MGRRRVECSASGRGFLTRDVRQAVTFQRDDVAKASTGWILSVEVVVVQHNGDQVAELTETPGDLPTEPVLGHIEDLQAGQILDAGRQLPSDVVDAKIEQIHIRHITKV